MRSSTSNAHGDAGAVERVDQLEHLDGGRHPVEDDDVGLSTERAAARVAVVAHLGW